MDPDQLASLLPAKLAVYVPGALVGFHILCNLLAISPLGTPPLPGPRSWKQTAKVVFYQVVTWGALNVGPASNRLQYGKTGIMVPFEERHAAKSTMAEAGLKVLRGKVPPEKP